MNYADLMRIILLIISFCLVSMVPAADVYRSVDERGNVIFSDTPVPGAERIRVEDIQTIAPGEMPKFEDTSAPKDVATYTKLAIVSPENNSAFQADDGKVTINAVVEPGLNSATGHYLVLYINGKEAASGTNSQFMLNNMDSGVYTANIGILDQKGKQVMSSPVISFTVIRSVSLPPKPPGNPPSITPVPPAETH